MRVFKHRQFSKFAVKQRISDAELLEAVQRAESGLIDADLGGGVIKQRIARAGQGRRGSYRSIILFKSGDKAFFIYGYPKSERENITSQELASFKRAAETALQLTVEQLDTLVEQQELMEISL